MSTMVGVNPEESKNHILGNKTSVISDLSMFECPNLKPFVKKEHLLNISPKHDAHLLSITEMLELYNHIREQYIKTEKNTVYNQLNNNMIRSLIKDKQNQRVSSLIQLDLLTEDVLEMAHEASSCMSLARTWLSPHGEIMKDPTVYLMQQLQENSSIEAALQCITRTNTMMEEVEIELLQSQQQPETELIKKEDNNVLSHSAHHIIESKNTSASSRTENMAAIPNTTTSSSSSSNSSYTDNIPLTPSSSSDEVDSSTFALPYLRDQYMYTHSNHPASLLEKQFSADLLETVTENTFQLAKKLDKQHRPRPNNGRYMNRYNERNSSSFIFLSRILADVKQESRDLVRPFLSSSAFPYLPALQRAHIYLQNHGEFQFHSSSGKQRSCENKSAASSTNTNNEYAGSNLLQQQGLNSSIEFTESMIAQPQQQGSADIPSTSELDDALYTPLPLPLPLDTVAMTTYQQQPLSADEEAGSADVLPPTGHCQSLEKKPSIPPTAAANPYTNPSPTIHTENNSSGAVELLSLLADRVCTGLHARAVTDSKQSRKALRRLRQRVAESIAAERAFIQSAVALCNTNTATTSGIISTTPATTAAAAPPTVTESTQRYNHIKQEKQLPQEPHITRDLGNDQDDVLVFALSTRTTKKVGIKRNRPSKQSVRGVSMNSTDSGNPNGWKNHALISPSLLSAGTTMSAKRQRKLTATSPSEQQSSKLVLGSNGRTTTVAPSSLQSSAVIPEEYPEDAIAGSVSSSSSESLHSISCDEHEEEMTE